MPTVLLVDDEPLLRSVLCEYLKFAGYEVVECRDGDEALQRVRASHIDIVVSDVLMPGMDGLALCREIRADGRACNTPFLFITARNVDGDMRAEMDRVGDGSILKPFEPHALLEAMRAAIQKRAPNIV